MSQNLTVETTDEDRFARATQIVLGEKVVQTPSFCTLVQNATEFASLMNLRLLNETRHLGAHIIRIFDAPTTILPRLRNQLQLSITDGKSVEQLFLNFNRKNIALIDPATEYLLYEFHAGKFLRALRNIRQTRQLDILIRYLEEREARKEKTHDLTEYERWKKAYHRKFWYGLDRNPMERGRFIGDFLELETMCGSDVLIPPVPIVDSEGMLDITIRINRLARAIAPRTKPYATYLLLQKGVLGDDALIEKVISYLKADPTQLTIVKVKNLDLWNSGYVRQREAYRKLMDTMYQVRKENPSKIYMALENWFVSFPSACYGFDIVSTSMHGYDRDSEFGSNVRGSWFDPDLMFYRPFDDLPAIMKNNDNHLPCYCPVCRRITNLDIDPDIWNIMRREHYVLTMNEFMRMIYQAIRDRSIELAREKLASSELARLQILIPRG